MDPSEEQFWDKANFWESSLWRRRIMKLATPEGGVTSRESDIFISIGGGSQFRGANKPPPSFVSFYIF